MTVGLLDYGGEGKPIVLVHGLMGRGRTWARHAPWLRKYGRVFTFDAAYHQGAQRHPDQLPRREELETERFVADLAEILHWIDLGPSILIGHSMGGLHAWCTASAYPELVSAVVIEDMVPEFPGQTISPWEQYFAHWPATFTSLSHAQEFFGSIAGRYFWEAFDSGQLHGDTSIWLKIAELWGYRNFWDEWTSMTQPALLIQGEHGIDTHNLMEKMSQASNVIAHVTVQGAGHLIHDGNTSYYRGAVEAFLAGLSSH